MSEFQIIEKNFKPLTNYIKTARNLADDVAKISLKKNEELVVSKDLFVEDIHFLRQDGGFKIASKLLLTNLSDIAASGAKPVYYLLGFSKNKNLDQNFLKEFTRGLKLTQNKFGISLIGGDTVESEKLFFSITIFGIIKKNQILSRDNAKDGDLIFVSGSIGDAFLGLKLKIKSSLKNLEKKDRDYLLERHFFPTPKIDLGKKLLAEKLSKCAIDVSDGLLADLNHLCQESKLDAEIFLEKIPLSSAAKNFLNLIQHIKPRPRNKCGVTALSDYAQVCHPTLVAGSSNMSNITVLDLISGGDDYELIFSTHPKNQQKILSLAKLLKFKISCIGKFTKPSTKKPKITLFDKNNKKINIKKFGYEH
jgi:thiamine-monophosphate kinase